MKKISIRRLRLVSRGKQHLLHDKNHYGKYRWVSVSSSSPCIILAEHCPHRLAFFFQNLDSFLIRAFLISQNFKDFRIADFYTSGKSKLPSKSQKVMDNSGAYFDRKWKNLTCKKKLENESLLCHVPYYIPYVFLRSNQLFVFVMTRRRRIRRFCEVKTSLFVENARFFYSEM